MPHYARFIAMVVLGLIAVGGGAWRMIRPRPAQLYEETAVLDAAVRARLRALRGEDKFRADAAITPPYPGPKSNKRHARLSGAIDALIDDILSEADGPMEASDLAGRMGHTVAALARTDPADIRRANGYMLEIWWLFGFRSAAGYFSAEDGGEAIDGFAEPLPPGWTAPDRPRVATTGSQAPVNASGAG